MFNNNYTEKELKEVLKRGFFWTTLGRIITIFCQFLAMVILARLLTPNEFALIGIALFFINISNIIVDAGMGGALVAKKSITELDISTLFVLNLSFSIMLYLILFLSSNKIAIFYEIDDLSLIINVIGLSIIISAVGKIHNTIFREN